MYIHVYIVYCHVSPPIYLFVCWNSVACAQLSGLTVHEANLEENEITFSGFPWTLRLRYIMEYASDLQEAR